VAPQYREVQIVAVKVNDIESRGVLKNQFQEPDVVRQGFFAFSVSPQSAGTGGD
jgi:hypothetical protein